MRITVEQLVKAVAAGIPLNELQSDYPELEKEDITAALLYAAQIDKHNNDNCIVATFPAKM